MPDKIYFDSNPIIKGERNQGLTLYENVLRTKDANFGSPIHYAKPTDQRSVEISEQNGTTFSDLFGPTNRNGSYHCLFLFRIPQLGQRTGLSIMERRISVEIFQPK